MDLDPARVASDPALRRVLEVARAWGVSPSRFTGREPVQTLVYDTAGRVVRIATAPEWTENDQALALALAGYEAMLCPGCGDHLDETTKREHSWAYEPAGPPTRCHRCTGKEIAAKPYEDQPQAGALFHRLHLNPQTVSNNLELIRLEEEQAAEAAAAKTGSD